MKLLIAEDNRVIQMIYGQLMGNWGYQYDLAENGEEAVALAMSHSGEYDLCLMDVEMPQMSGIEATRTIRRKLDYIPIMGLTAESSYQEACYEAGMDGFMTKPCPANVLFDKINNLSVKIFQLVTRSNGFDVTEVMPVDQRHAKELKDLKDQGLVKMRLDGPENREIIAHKNVPNKISHDFNVLKQSMTEFLNRDPDRPTLCDFYRGSSNCIVETFIDEKEYKYRLNEEDEKIEKFSGKYYVADDD
ncbi:MAG: response regulator [Gammaproteobacteria bacterium]|nr:response regulator [Gammaproteobacteria bacterium]